MGKKEALLMPFSAFKKSFFDAGGYKDGFTGLFLSAFWAWYQTSAMLSLYKIQKQKTLQAV